MNLTLSYSVNGGRSWVTAGSITISDPQQRTADLTVDLGATAVISRFVQLRVSYSGVVDWAPALVGLWADYEAIGVSAKRRRWQLSVQARDRTVLRDGGVDPRDGRAIAADLWQAWAAPGGIPFTDLDFAATGLTQCEGTTLAHLDGAWRVLASDKHTRRYPVFDLEMREVGALQAPYPTNIPWPTLVPDADSWLLVGFNGRQTGGPVPGYGTHGDVVFSRTSPPPA